MFKSESTSTILEIPRERHYTLGHEAFRQMCEHDPHQFFEIMASPAQQTFIAELIKQVELSVPDDDTELDLASIEVTVSRIGNQPFVIIKMPEVKAYVECIYVGIVSMMDINNPQDFPHPEISYFTLELGEGEQGESRIFCQWQGDTHYNLAEMGGNSSVSDFELLIKQRLEDITN